MGKEKINRDSGEEEKEKKHVKINQKRKERSGKY